MTPRHQRFVDEYLLDLNATQAAMRAGYSVRTAEQQGVTDLDALDALLLSGCRADEARVLDGRNPSAPRCPKIAASCSHA